MTTVMTGDVGVMTMAFLVEENTVSSSLCYKHVLYGDAELRDAYMEPRGSRSSS